MRVRRVAVAVISTLAAASVAVLPQSSAAADDVSIASFDPGPRVPTMSPLFFVSDGPNSVTIGWDPAQENGSPVTGYDVTQTLVLPAPYGGTFTTHVGPEVTTATMSHADVDMGNLEFSVVADSDAGSSASRSLSTPLAGPSQPISITARSVDALTISWGYGGTAWYNTSVRLTSGSSTWTQAVPEGQTTTISGLPSGTDFSVTVGSPDGHNTSLTRTSTRGFRGAVTTQLADRTANSVSLSWTAPRSGGVEVTGYDVSVDTGSGVVTQSLGTATRGATISGLVSGHSYPVSVVATSADGSTSANWLSYLPVSAPSDMASLSQTDRGLHEVQLQWSAPETNGTPVTGYVAQIQDPSDQTWSDAASFGPETTTGWIAGLEPAHSYRVRVVASSDLGRSGGSAIDALTAFPPNGPSVNVIQRSATALDIGWGDPEENGTPATGYVVQVKAPGQDWQTWARTGPDAREARLSGLSPATWYDVNVLADSDAGLGSGGGGVQIATTGTRALRVRVTTPTSAAPITGGAVTWQTEDGTLESSQAFGLTANGVVDLLRVPAAAGVIKLSGGLTPSGVQVGGRWHVQLQSDAPLDLTVPSDPQPAEYAVHVQLSNGAPVVGAKVDFPDLSSTWRDGAFTYFTPRFASAGTTGAGGRFSPVGFCDEAVECWPWVTVTYDDGVLVQHQDVLLTAGEVTTVTLQEMPWLETADTLTGRANEAVSVPVTLAGAEAGRTQTAARADAVKVSIEPPPGASQKVCKSKLKGTIGKSGRVVLKVCASKSGYYRLAGSGAVATTLLLLKAHGTPSMPVRSLSGISPKSGQAQIAWSRPLYTGGAKVKRYTVILSGHCPRIKKSVTTRSLTLTGLSHATTYDVKVTAVTKYGVGQVAWTTVPVA